MRKRSRALRTVAVASLICLIALSIPAPGAASPGDPTSDPPAPGGTPAAPRLSELFPDRRSASYGAAKFLSYVAGQLQLSGWLTEVQPYSVVTKVESPADKSILFSVAEGENLLALSGSSLTDLDYLIVAAYDNMFADDPENEGRNSFTAASSEMALEISQYLDKGSAKSYGIAFVSGHYQHGAGVQALAQALKAKGIAVRQCVVLGDVQASALLPLVTSPDTPVSLVDNLFLESESAGLEPYLATGFTLDLLGSVGRSPGVSPESLSGVPFSGEHYVLEALDIPVVTVGFPAGNPSARLKAGTQPAEVLESRVRLAAKAVSSVLNAAPEPVGPLVGSMRVVRLLRRTCLVTEQQFLAVGATVSLILMGAALFLGRTDPGSLYLVFGTTVASAASLFLHRLFTRRPETSYASDLYPGRAMALVFIFFCLLVLAAFLRLWSTRSRIHHLHKRLPKDGEKPPVQAPPSKSTRGSAWGLGVLAALALGATLSRSELLPSLLLSGAAHAVGTLLLRIRTAGERPPASALWLARLLYLAPLAAVFWAGSPVSPEGQSLYRSAWTGMNQGALTSGLALAVVAASLMSTMRFPNPVRPNALRFTALSEIAVIALILICGFFLPARSGLGIPTWAIFEECLGSDTRVLLASPSPITEVTLTGAPEGIPARLTRRTGITSEKVSEREDTDWARLGLKVQRVGEDGGQNAVVSADLAFTVGPDALLLRVGEMGTRTSRGTGFRVTDVGALLGAGSENAPSVDTLEVPPGYSVTFMWWKPSALPPSFELGVGLKANTRIETQIQAVYLERSYLGILPETEGVTYYTTTRITAGAL